MLSRRVPRDYTPNPLAALLQEKREAGRPILDLTGTNPTSVGLPTLTRRGLAAMADPEGARYEPDPRGRREAREAVAAYYAARGTHAAAIDPARIFLTASTSEAYAHLFRLLCDPEDEVLVPRPSYPLLAPLARLEETHLREYRLAYNGRWTLDLDSLEAAIGPKTRAGVLIEPNNPTGSCLSPKERTAVESICAERGITIISDEVFGDFPWPPRLEVLPSWNDERRVPTFVLGGISKLCGLPQMKLGWIAASGPERAMQDSLNGLEWIADLFLSVGTPVQVALPRLLEERAGFQSAVRERIEANLAILRGPAGTGGARSAAADVDPLFSLLEGEGGWSAVLRFKRPASAAGTESVAEWALRSRDVLVHPGHFYDLPGDDDVVVSLLTPPTHMAEAALRIRDG
ncbi:MAG TPA: pyridoxal phosphate-dependent aminotransferase [Candidatus Dormibacteraeota bacterium]|nr:pyridoxal phosphate-dependent aminotransferase [Candidatus Dormibacteraeota bacterium]